MQSSSLFPAATALFASFAAAGHQPCTTDSLTAILGSNPDLTLNFVHSVPQNGSFGEPDNIPFPTNATRLPALCAISVNVKSSDTSSFDFGLFLPDTTWNERFLTAGNGGFGGGINWPDMGRYSQYGFATMSTDTGHSSNAGDSTWALNNPESLIDWSWRSLHGSVVNAKDIIQAYYSSSIEYSYYVGCSNGGRQGLKEIQLYPDSFDAITVGAPAWWATNAFSAFLWYSTLNYPNTTHGYVPPTLGPVISLEIMRQCDPQDGLVDGIISDPEGCNFNFETLMCTANADPTSCLSVAQLDTIKQLYTDWINYDQTLISPAISLSADPTIWLMFPNPLGYGFYRNMLYNDSNWDYTQLSYSDIQFALDVNPANIPADDFNLAPYLERGGKIIMYHGDADPLIPARHTTHFYNQVRRTLAPQGVNLDDFFRLYLIPGMEHCFNAAVAPWYIAAGHQEMGGATHSVPGYEDADHDVILAMQRWAEQGVAPGAILASKFVNDNVDDGLARQRPLCVYPEQAKYIGGDPDLAQNWECRRLY